MITTAPPAAPPPALPTALTRRGLFTLAGASAALAATPLAARSWGSGFTHGVASGEPGADRVMLWTRFVAEQPTDLVWQVSESEDFTRPRAEGSARAAPERDWCAKSWAGGLLPGRLYFYRFIAPDGSTSPVGRTRTLPAAGVERFRLAVFSCSNYGFGWFNAYGHAAQANDCDLAVHLGDYIYEYGIGTYPDPGQGAPGRVLEPASEIVTLTDYRLRYATYRADPDCQRLHQLLPMISVWDDHESANDAWRDGAQNHQSDTEGDWATRKAIAKRVYREWMPVSDEVYTTYQIGDLATLLKLDTRLEGRDQQLDLGKVLAGAKDPLGAMEALTRFRDGEWANPDRQLLGPAQEAWLASALKQSRASGTHWQVLVQQVLMGNLRTPVSIVDQLASTVPDFVSQRLRAAALASQVGLPANMDAWDGYPAARARVFKAALAADANLLVLAGDTHNAWAFELAQDGVRVGVELGVCSVSSPGFESYLSFIKPADLASALVSTNPQLQWADTAQRGYMVVELTPERALTEYRFTGSPKQRSTRLAGTKVIASAKGSRRFDIYLR
jgi:alkaline phosphatase D